MALLSFLDRFRPAGAPGPAGPVGVPSVDDQGPAAELAAVFAALAPDVVASQAILEEAQKAAQSAVPRAREQATAILTQARIDAGAERATAAGRVEQAAAELDEEVREAARRQADQVAARGETRIGALVDEIVEDVFTGLLAG